MALIRERGQVSIEFILLVAIALVYINMYILPAAEDSSQAAADVKAVADTKVSAMKLANALNEAASSSGDMKKTINIFLPENAAILYEDAATELTYEAVVSNIGWNPDEDHCVDEMDGPDLVGWRCSSTIGLLSPVDSGAFIFQGPLFWKIIVQKTGSSITVT